MLPPPYPLAMIACDYVHADPTTGKMYVLGTFSAINSQVFPLVYPTMSVYAALTDGHGRGTIRVEMIDSDEEPETLVMAEVPVEYPDPRAVVECRFYLNNILFRKPGEYRLQLFSNKEFLLERRIMLRQL